MRSKSFQIVLSVLVFCAAFCFKPFLGEITITQEEPSNLAEQNLAPQQKEKEAHDRIQVLEKIAVIKSEAQEELKKEFLAFSTELESWYLQTIQPRLQAACANSAKKLSEYGSSWEIVKKMAADKIWDSSRAERFIASKLESRIGPILSEIANTVDSMMVEYCKRIKMISLKAFEKIYNLPGAIEVLGFDPGLQTVEMRSEEVFSICLNKSPSFFIDSLPLLDLLQTKIVRELIRHALAGAHEVFGKQISRLAKTMPLVFLDGPLPIGDLVFFGRAAFVAYDINRKKKKYRRKLEGLLAVEAAASLSVFFRGCLEEAQKIQTEAHNMLENAVENLSIAAKS